MVFFTNPLITRICCTLLVGVVVLGAFGSVGEALAQAPGQLNALNLEGAIAQEGTEGRFGCPGQITGCLAFASYWVMMGFAWIAGVAGTVLNFAVMETVVGMGQLVGELPAINTAWVVLRDIANVFLLFLTIFIGIATILGISGYSYKTLLWRVLIAAIFVNFSIFFTKAVIDISNLSASELYKLLLVQSVPANAAACSVAIEGSDFANSECLRYGIAGAFQNQLKLMSVVQNAQTAVAGNAAARTIHVQIIFVGALGSILFIIMTFIFGAAALMLIVRFIVLVILIILSPVAFVMWVTKVGGGAGSRWWNTLLNQAFFAPALFLMFWISYLIIAGMAARFASTALNVASFSQAAQGNMSSMSILMFFVVSAGFLIASLMIAKAMGAHGADAAMKTGKNWSRAASGTIAANTLSRGGAGLNLGYQKFMREVERGRAENSKSRIGRNMNRLTTFVTLGQGKSGSFLDRSITTGLTKGVGKDAKWFGTASLKERQASSLAREKEVQADIRATDRKAALKAKAGEVTDEQIRMMGSMSQKELDEMHDELLANLHNAVHLSTSQLEAIFKSDKYTEDEKDRIRQAKYKDTIKALQSGDDAELRKVMPKLKLKDAEFLRNELTQSKKAAKHLSADQLEQITKSTSFTDQNKKKVLENRFEDVITAASNNDAALMKTALKQISEKEAELLGDELLQHSLVIKTLPQNYIDNILKSNNVTSGQKDFVRTERKQHFERAIAGGTIGSELRGMKAEHVAKLDKSVLTNPDTIKEFNTSMLIEMAKTLNTGDRQTIRNSILAEYAAIQSDPARLASVGAGSPGSENDRRIVEMGRWLKTPTAGSIF